MFCISPLFSKSEKADGSGSWIKLNWLSVDLGRVNTFYSHASPPVHMELPGFFMRIRSFTRSFTHAEVNAIPLDVQFGINIAQTGKTSQTHLKDTKRTLVAHAHKTA